MIRKAYLEITNLCNLSCTFCHKTARPIRRMTAEEFEVLTDRLADIQHLYFHLMGEPTIHPLLPHFIRRAREKGFLPMLTTNGTLLERCGDALITPDLHRVNISLHSFEANRPDAHADYIQKVAAYADKANQAGIIISMRLWNNGCDEGRNQVTLDTLQKVFPGQWVTNTRGYRIRNGLFLEWGDRFAWPDMSCENMGESVFCYGLKDHFAILCDGRVVPCCLDREGAITLGNIFETPAEEILNSPRANAMREGFQRRCATEELCRRCGYARRF